MLAADRIFDERIGDTLRVWVPNGGVLALVSVVDIKEWASLGLLLLSIGYTVWRWRRDYFVACEGCRQGKVPGTCTVPMRRRPWWCPKRV